MRSNGLGPLSVVLLLGVAFPSQAADMSDELSADSFTLGASQCQFFNASLVAERAGGDVSVNSRDNECVHASPLQVALNYQADDTNEFFVVLGFATGNGLEARAPWILSPFAADLEDDVKDINGRGRDYLLVMAYKHTFTLRDGSTVGASAGILDSTWYLDGNAYANDWSPQFINEVFVNSASHGLPSYDAGAALEYRKGAWSISAVGMNIGENDAGNNFNFWGAQFGYHPQTTFGPGNYRVIAVGTSSAFPDPMLAATHRRSAWGLSFDQAFGEVVGGFLRFAWQSDDAAVAHQALYSGGLNFSGSGWGRICDNIGVGGAYLPGGNLDVENTYVAEAYYRAGLGRHLSVSLDVQYMKDDPCVRILARPIPPAGLPGCALPPRFETEGWLADVQWTGARTRAISRAVHESGSIRGCSGEPSALARATRLGQ